MMINERGITLLETLIVVALVGIIVAISVPLSLTVIRRYRAEDQTRKFYTNLMEARTRAMQRNIPYLVRVTTTGFDIFEDANSNGTAENYERNTELSSVVFQYPIEGTIGATAISGTAQIITVNRRGLMDPDSMLRVPQDSRINCIITSATRVGLGRYNEVTNTCQVQ